MSKLHTAIVGMLLVAHVTCAETANLLSTPGFEEGVDPWVTRGTAAAIIRADWRAAETSQWAFGVGNDEGLSDAYGIVSQDITLPRPLLRTRKCSFAVYVMREDNYTGKLVLKLDFLGAKGRVLGEFRELVSSLPKWKWCRKEVWGLAPSGTETIHVECSVENMEPGEGLSFIWIDDASVTLQ